MYNFSASRFLILSDNTFLNDFLATIGTSATASATRAANAPAAKAPTSILTTFLSQNKECTINSSTTARSLESSQYKRRAFAFANSKKRRQPAPARVLFTNTKQHNRLRKSQIPAPLPIFCCTEPAAGRVQPLSRVCVRKAR